MTEEPNIVYLILALSILVLYMGVYVFFLKKELKQRMYDLSSLQAEFKIVDVFHSESEETKNEMRHKLIEIQKTTRNRELRYNNIIELATELRDAEIDLDIPPD